MRRGLARPGTAPVLGYEEALGYGVGELVRDKDGLSAALCAVELAAVERARGRTLVDRLDDLARRHGLHATGRPGRFAWTPDGPARIAAADGGLAGLRPGRSWRARRAVRTVLDLARPDPDGRPRLVEPPDHPPADVVVVELEAPVWSCAPAAPSPS